jgi:hypothetical protein
MNVLFEQACKLEKILTRDKNLKGEKCEEYSKKVEELYLKMKESKLSELA